MRPSLVVWTLAVASAASLTASVARANEPNEQGGAAAESLFQEGRRAMDAKKYAEACPKFAASHKLAPAIGTLLNLADCYEKNGQLASAWARFREAVSLAQRLGRADREKTARDRAEKLEPRLTRLTIYARDSSIDVSLDGNPLDAAVLGTPIPVDPGRHTIEASAKGKKAFSTTLEVSERTKTPSFELPDLEPLPTESKTASGAASREPPAEPAKSGGAQRTLGFVALGAGVVGAGVGTYFGLETRSKWDEAKAHCQQLECDRTGFDLAAEAKMNGNVSTIAFIASGAFVVGGAILLLTAPSSRPRAGSAPSPQVGVGLAGASGVFVRGAF